MIYSFMGYPYVTPLSITPEESFLQDESLNFKQKGVYKGAQRWLLSVTLKDAGNSGLFSDLMSLWMQKGIYSSFPMAVPQHLGTERDFTEELIYGSHGAPVVVSTAAAGDRVVEVRHPLSNTYYGSRFITFSNHLKVYAVETTFIMPGDVASTEMRVYPELQTTIPAGTTINFFNVNMQVFNTAENAKIQYLDGTMQTVTLNVTEEV